MGKIIKCSNQKTKNNNKYAQNTLKHLKNERHKNGFCSVIQSCVSLYFYVWSFKVSCDYGVVCMAMYIWLCIVFKAPIVLLVTIWPCLILMVLVLSNVILGGSLC